MRFPYCYFHRKRHRPTHCRQCGKELPNGKLWYCGGADGACASEYWSLNIWARARELALERAGHKCEQCGEPAIEVHHIEPVKGARRTGEANRKENLMALCFKHHVETRKQAATIRKEKAKELQKQLQGRFI